MLKHAESFLIQEEIQEKKEEITEEIKEEIKEVIENHQENHHHDNHELVKPYQPSRFALLLFLQDLSIQKHY